MNLPIDSQSKTKLLNNRYYLHEVIAQSNYSRIFLASDLALDHRKCAIKQFYPGFCPTKMQSTIESAFLHEVAISKKVAGKHLQLCQFYNYFVDSGSQYLVQEWIEGQTLEAKLSQQTQLSESETKHILNNLLLVLDCIHSLGIVHNDLKPSNIILRLKDNLPVLIDFGVARQTDSLYGQKSIAGTPGYMSLEQAMGKAVVTNDFYSLGLTAIYLLTGRPPQTIDFNSSQDHFWQQVKTSFEPQLVATIDQATALIPQKRFSSAGEMRAMLHNSTLILANKPISKFRIKLQNWTVVLLLAIFGTWLYRHYWILQLDSKPPITMSDLLIDQPGDFPQLEEKPQPKILEATNNALKNVIFVPGTSATTIVQNLGEPVWRRAGFWANSIAWSYENMVVEGFDLGYIFDRRTNKLRQAEIAVPPETDLSTLELAMKSFLATKSLPPKIQQGLASIYQRQQNTYNFTVGNLEGIVQRNQKDRIYLAVWQADFH